MKIIETIEDFDEFGEPTVWSLEVSNNKGNERVISAFNMTFTPEDATLARDLSFVYSIPDLLKLAYNAGLDKENIEIIFNDEKNE